MSEGGNRTKMRVKHDKRKYQIRIVNIAINYYIIRMLSPAVSMADGEICLFSIFNGSKNFIVIRTTSLTCNDYPGI